MRLLIIRHGDPDYTIDSLTEKGWKEAELLSQELCKEDITCFYVSPYGRARDTASCTLKKMNRTAETLPWLKEFDVQIYRPDDPLRKNIIWDWLPADWTAEPRFYQADHWFENERLAAAHAKEEYVHVTEQFDALMEKHGYKREGGFYRAVRPNKYTIALFCHFGVQMVILSHLWGISPVPLWHGITVAPTSVTTLVTEERREGKAFFCTLSIGNTNHLYVHGEPPAFAGRFCECFDDDTRHD